MHLYELTEAMQRLDEIEPDPDTGEFSESDAAQIDALEGEWNAKAVSIAKYRQNIKADIDACKAEERRIADRRHALENKESWLKSYLLQNMQALGIDKAGDATITVAVQQGQPKVQFAPDAPIPKAYAKHRDPEWDTTAVKNALKAGEPVPGATLIREPFVRIR